MGVEDKMCEGENQGLYMKGVDRYETFQVISPIKQFKNIYILKETDFRIGKRTLFIDSAKGLVKKIK